MYINFTNVNTGGTEVTGTNYTTETFNTGSTVTVPVRATTGTYLCVPAVSDTLTIRGMNILVICSVYCHTKSFVNSRTKNLSHIIKKGIPLVC